MKRTRIRYGRVAITLIIFFAIIAFIVNFFFKVDIEVGDKYTTNLLKQCTREDFETVETSMENKDNVKKGFSKNGKWLEPNSDNDMKIMYIIDMLVKSKDTALTYMPMHFGYDVDEKKIENRVYIISKKFPEKKVYIEVKEFCDRDGKKYMDKAICVETKK